MDPFLLHVAVLELRHSVDHQSCGYGRTTEATVSLKVNDAAVAPVLTTFGSDVAFSAQLNPEDRVTIAVTPKNPVFHPIEGGFVYQGDGQFRRRADTPVERAGFAPPQSIQFDITLGLVPLNAALFQCYISPLADVTAKVGGILSTAAGGADIISQLEAAETNHWIRETPVPSAGSLPQYERRTVDPRANIRCYELGGKVVPKLVMTTWPKSIDNAVSALPGLIMIHPFLGGYYAGSRYPFGQQHLWDAGLKYFGFRGVDPLLSAYADRVPLRPHKKTMDRAAEEMGLPHQVAAGGKRAAVVMPVNFGASIGRFADGDFAHTFCHDMNGHGLRSEEAYFDPPALGRWAIAAFSSGNRILAEVLNKNRGNRFYDGVVAEVYAMDPPPAGGQAGLALDKISDAASAWLERTPGDRRFRHYSQQASHPKFNPFKTNPGDPLPRPAFVLPASAGTNPADPAGQRRTLVSTPATTLFAAAKGLDPTLARRFPGGYGEAGEGHRIVNQTMIVDAMRRSGFPSIDGSRE